jgi:hypothetical protein
MGADLADVFKGLWEQLVGRLHGPMAFRLALQPLVAVTFAIRSGLRDARAGRPPFLQTVLFDRGARGPLLRQGLSDVGRLFVFVAAIDLVYQLKVLHGVYPFETLVIVTALAIVPYAIVRGPTNRIFRRAWRGRPPAV